MSRSRTPSRSRSPVKRKSSPDADEGVSPFLIRVFVTKGKHTPMIDFDEGKFPLKDEFQVYAWKTSTPSSLISLLYPAFPPIYRSPAARFSFRHIYVDASQRGLYRNKDLVSFSGKELMAKLAESNPEKSRDIESRMDMELDDDRALPSGGGNNAAADIEEKSLDDYGFITGDLLSVSLFVPEPKMQIQRPGPINGSTGVGGGAGTQSFGWSEAQSRNGTRDKGREGDRERPWGRGEPLPPQNSIRGGRGGFGAGAGGDREPAGGGNWRGGPMGIRGAGANGGRRPRSRSPDYGRERNGHGQGRRSRSRSRSLSRSRSPPRRRPSHRDRD